MVYFVEMKDSRNSTTMLTEDASSKDKNGTQHHSSLDDILGPRPSGRECLANYAENASCNGIPNIYRAEHVARRVFWIAVFLAGLGLTIYQIENAVETFYEYSVNVQVNVTTATKLTFPAVTLCNINPARKSLLYSQGAQYLGDVMPNFFESNGSSTVEGESGQGRAEFREDFLRSWAAIPERERQAMGHTLQDSILDCIFDGQECDLERGSSDFTTTSNPYHGNCWTFNWGVNGSDTHVSYKTGPAHGLVLEVYLDQAEYVSDLTEAAGVRLVVHDNQEMPFPEINGMYLSPGTVNAINIREVSPVHSVHVSIINVKKVSLSRLPSPYPAACWDGDDASSREHDVYADVYGTSYAGMGCMMTCYQAYVHLNCSCADPTIEYNSPVVHYLLDYNATRLEPCKTPQQAECEESVHLQYVRGELSCNCPVPCTELSYEYTVSQAAWPNQAYGDSYFNDLATRYPAFRDVLLNGNTASGNVLKIEVFFEELNYESIFEIPAYDTWSLLADVGGVFGFYLGLSIVALFEFLELGMDMIFVALKKGRRVHRRISMATSVKLDQ